MPFHFSLNSLLDLRRSEQRQQEFILQKENAKVNSLCRKIANLEQDISQMINVPPHGRIGAELRFDQERQILLKQQRAQFREQLESAREQQKLATAALTRAWQKREALEILRRREYVGYSLNERRREQRRQDDWFMQQRHTR
ncbi:MAG TPA: flagellar FliJ family protein [Terriglobales bacterium]|nr:flagellar FliJ family protein [Terriglobales bacterium]